MTLRLESRHSCPVCEENMIQRERGPAQRDLPSEHVCWNMACREFGVYRRMGDRS